VINNTKVVSNFAANQGGIFHFDMGTATGLNYKFLNSKVFQSSFKKNKSPQGNFAYF
jgi:hypothetical protein